MEAEAPANSEPAAAHAVDAGRSGLAGLSWAAIANLLTALGNTVSIFAISLAAGTDERFGLFAGTLAVAVFVYSVGRGVLGETLTLQHQVEVGPASYLRASVLVAAILGGASGLVLAFASSTRSLALLAAFVIVALVVNDALRHWSFRQSGARQVAISDGAWLAASVVLYVAVLATDLGPRWVFGLWGASGLVAAMPLLRVRAEVPRDRALGALQWLRATARLSWKLAAEASAAAAAIAIPLAATALVTIDGHEAGAIRLLQTFFGFQQIAFFSALVTIGSAANATRAAAYRAGLVLAGAGVVLSLVVAVVVSVLPVSLLTAVMGDSAETARAGVWSFAVLQALIAVSNGALLSLRARGRATDATGPRVIGALIATVAATAMMGGGVAGFSVGSAIGVVVFLALLIGPLRRA